MSVSPEFKNYILDQFAGLGDLAVKKMFGGFGIWCDFLFFAILIDDTLYLKGDLASKAEYIKNGMAPFRVKKRKGQVKQYDMNYFSVPTDILENRSELRQWGQKALNIAAANKKTNRIARNRLEKRKLSL